MDYQVLFNAVFGICCLMLGWFGRTIWGGVRDLTTDVAAFREEVAKDYVRKDDFNRIADRLFEKLDMIHDKLDRKMDK